MPGKHWIPAFAGMTQKRRANQIFHNFWGGGKGKGADREEAT